LRELEQSVLCALLRILVKEDLLSEQIQEKAQKEILRTLDWPDFFCYANGGKEQKHGST